MSSPESAGAGPLAALKTYELSLRERNVVLAELARASREMHNMLVSDATADISGILARREQCCLQYADVCSKYAVSDELMVRGAETAACSGERESAALGMSVLSLYGDAQDLAEEIMTCQAESEVIMRTRLQVTAKALKQSVQRTKLNAAYGPAHRHSTPVFMDQRK